MKKNNIFDNVLKTEIKENIEEISTDRDLFEEAWAKKEDYERKFERRNYYMKRVKLAAFALGTCISLGGLCFGVSPTVRAAVSTFFGMDDNGNVVEETMEDTGYVNSSINLDDSNKAVIEELLGYKIAYPEKVGNYIMNDKNGIAGISVKDVKGKDMDKVDELIGNATDYKALNEELSKDYSVYFHAAGLYTNTVNDDNPIVMTIDRKAGDKVSLKKKDTEKEVKNIQGVDCIIYEYPEAFGNEDVTRDENGLITSITTDKTKKPEVKMNSGVAFCYDGYVYTIENHSEEEELAFAEEYIKALK